MTLRFAKDKIKSVYLIKSEIRVRSGGGLGASFELKPSTAVHLWTAANFGSPLNPLKKKFTFKRS